MSEAAGVLTVHLRIEGRVQAVGFRYWTRNHAERLGLDGWVRNRRDGAVEAVFSGPTEAVRQMERLFEEGPRGAQVQRVRIMRDAVAAAPGFEIKPTL